MTPLVLPLALLGCAPQEEPVDPPIGEFIENTYEVAGFEASSNVGNAPLPVLVRSVNSFAASIPSEPTALTVDGASQTVAFDGVGYGQIRFTTAGTHTIDDGQNVVDAQVHDATWPGFGVSRAFEAGVPAAERAVDITTGSVIAAGRELWYVGPETAPHRVLDADGAIKGLSSGDIDVDGVKDVIAWSETTVYLMRGRLNGGLAWGAALTADRHRVGGAAIGELTDDNLPDLAIAWTSSDGPSKLDIWHGNGLFGFEAAEPRNLPSIPISLGIGDSTGEGKNQITVLTENGDWARFIQGSEVRYMPIGPRTPEEIDVPLGSTVEATGDINGDGGDEMWFVGPLTPGSPRKVLLVDIVGNKIEFVPLNPQGAHISRTDLDGNGLADHVELQETAALRSLSFDETSTNSYTPRGLGELPVYGPLVTADIVDHDGIPDLFVAGTSHWWWWRGFNDPEDSDTYWQIGEQALIEAGTTIGPIIGAELDGNSNTTEIIGFEDQNGATALVIWSWDPATESVSALGSVVVSNIGVDALDAERCGDHVYVLLEGVAVRVNVADPTNPIMPAVVNTGATAVACGTAPSGGTAALLDAGSVEVFDLSLTSVTLLTTPGAVDLAIGDIGNGPEVRTCDTAGCSIVYWADAGPDGAFASSSNAGITVDDGDVVTIDGTGALSVADIDANGTLDLAAVDASGMITVHRSNNDSVGFAEIFHSRNIAVGALAFGDADGDGEPDLWMRDGMDRLMYSVAPSLPLEEDTSSTTSSGTGTTP